MKTGDLLSLGTYPQGEDKDIRSPIQWRVIEVRDGSALLLSDKALDYRMYHESFRSVSWHSCTLRRWLNDEFLHSAFSKEEQDRLLDTDTDRESTDKVFLLSRDDLDLLEDLKAVPTEYANIYGSYIRVPHARWWLRSRGNTPLLVQVVSDDGVNLFGLGVALKSVAIRPAIRISAE